MTQTGHLISVQVGQPQERISAVRDGQEATWTSAIVKNPTPGRVPLGALGLEGDAQADLKHHGGKDKAVCCYASEFFPDWCESLGFDTAVFGPGAFGENFTLRGMTEETVCIGDVFSVGTARVQISQPRMPCYKLGRRWQRAQLPQEAMNNGRTGFYLRVLEPGEVGPGDELVLQERPLPDWTVAQVNNAMYVHKADAALADTLGRLPLLAEDWRSPFRRRAGLIRYNAQRRTRE